jgi:hypothetical protein
MQALLGNQAQSISNEAGSSINAFLGLSLSYIIGYHVPQSSIYSMNETTWDAFNYSISGRLYNGEPMFDLLHLLPE